MADDLTQSWALTHQDKAMLQELLDNPPAPTPKLLALFDSHKDFNNANRLIMSAEHLPS